MRSNAACWRQRLAALTIVASLLTSCATAGSEPRVVTVCPSIVKYSREFRARAADDLALLPETSAIVEMLGDYAVMREQARSCRR